MDMCHAYVEVGFCLKERDLIEANIQNWLFWKRLWVIVGNFL